MSALGQNSLVGVDRVRMIRRSIRCLVFGLIGVVPFLGVTLAWLALGLHRQVLLETGERWHPGFLHRLWLAGLLIVPVLDRWAGLERLSLFVLLLLMAQGAWLRQQYRRESGREFNPARRELYWGAGLAYTGLAITVAAAVWFLARVARME